MTGTVISQEVVTITPLTSERTKVPRGPRELKTGFRNGRLWTLPCGVPWKEANPPRESLKTVSGSLLFFLSNQKRAVYLWAEEERTDPNT